MPGSSPTSSPARASTTARSPTPARSRSRSASPSGWPRGRTTIGDLKIKISGCINACGHHHVGHIGILGVEKNGEELYQLLLGGSGDEDAALGEIIGPGFGPDGIVDAVETVVDTYLELRASPDEPFLAAYRRLGPAPFKEALYAAASLSPARELPSPLAGRGSGRGATAHSSAAHSAPHPDPLPAEQWG